MDFPILTFITFLPILGMVIIMAMRKEQVTAIKSLTLVITEIQVLLAIIILANYNSSLGGVYEEASFQFVEKFRWIDIDNFSWIGTIKVDYFLGVDGISVPLVLLTTIVTFVAAISYGLSTLQ